MTEKLKIIGGKLEKAADRTLLFLCICVFFILTYYSARYTMVENAGIPSDTRDNAGLNLLVLAAVTSAAVLLHRLSRNNRFCSFKPYIVGITSAFVYIISAVWVSGCHIVPAGDGASLCDAAIRIMAGYYNDIDGGYMAIFPHQFSLLSVIHFIFSLFGVGNYKAFQQINALCMPILFYSGYKFLQLLCEELEVVIYYILFFLGCLPLFVYVPLVYGEIISITFTMVLIWQVARYCKTGRKSCFLWGTIAIVLACMVRKNSLIVLIAVGIVLAIHSIRKANPLGILWVLVMALSISGSDKLVHAYYEKISGIEIAGGIPYISWIRMGLQDSWTGPGWFDNSSVEAFSDHDYDTEQTALAEKERLKEILNDMWADKAYGIDFFQRKILSQWNSPGYYYAYETENFDCAPGELPALVKRIYYDDKTSVDTYMDRYQFVLYFYAAVSAVVLFADSKKKHCLAEHLLYIAIMGGFLFSAFWESRSRYVLPYVVYMIPLAAVGIYRLTEAVNKYAVRAAQNSGTND